MRRSKVLSAASLGLAIVCSGQPVVAAPASVAAVESQPDKKRNSGMPVAVWIAIGTAVLIAVTAARRRRNNKTGPGSDT